MNNLFSNFLPYKSGIPSAHFDITDKPNDVWRQSASGKRITVARNPILSSTSKIFTMGSCFAMEIRNALSAKDFDVYPKYEEIKFNPERQKIDLKDVPFYDTFTIRQEIEQAFSRSHFKLIDFIKHTHKLTNHFEIGGKISYQDPHRKKVFASDIMTIADLSVSIDNCIAYGLRNSDIYIFTLGLIETWNNAKTGKYYCIPPYDQTNGFGDAQFHLSTYEENLNNMRYVCSLISQHRPGKKIVLTVSPVGLGRTMQDKDVVIATIEAKSILRAVTAQICREFDNVSYWPSYELSVKDNIFKEDGRHVRQDSVGMIVDTFIEAHMSNS